ncbi:MAG: FAD-binding oxidoreductase [Emcibacter sp.]|nr:FAD-binding oxidoreductase [Emcibacter sp.]
MTIEPETADFIIIGGGIAGASAGYELRDMGKIIILEKESQPGYHTTGRSAAIFQKGYNGGDPVLHAIIKASEDFLHNPPNDFVAHPLLSPRDLFYITTKENAGALGKLQDNLSEINVGITLLDHKETRRALPHIADDYQDSALMEEDVADIDVSALHEGYLRAIKSRGGQIISNAEVKSLCRQKGQWRVTSAQGEFCAPIIINAAGAWVDQIAEMAHISPIHIQPLRRTMALIDIPVDMQPAKNDWPIVMDAAEKFYFKPDSGKILVTPADQKLTVPCDAQPEEIDIAHAAHCLEKATNSTVNKIDHSWAGLRNHVADGHPVVGFDPEKPGFFWLAGQGGFGIKTAPAMGRITAALIMGRSLPQDILDLGLREKQICVGRLK